jgi:NAD-dependent dihydropyrimidine dehydrogenase PreA subunit
MKDLPVWGKECTQCLACIHRCPVQAIEYGKATIGKRRYVHPDLKEGK